MQIIIELSEEIYKNIIATWEQIHPQMHNALKNGTVLPKGHGRLIDADKLKERCLFMSNDDTAIEGMEYVTKGMIENAHAVIKADKEIENEDSN